MSHFTVLVIGDDIETALQPFHEFECTGEVDQFVQSVDITTECREKGLDWFGLDDKTVADESEVNLHGAHKYGFAVVSATGEVVKAVNRTNPNKKWDWWQLGGRWSGFLKLKPGATGQNGETGLMGSHFAKGADRADQARKGDIDIAGMRDEAGTKAGTEWDHAHAITGGQPWEAWDVVRERHAGNIDGARAAYAEQASVKALKAADQDRYGWQLDDTLAGTREAFVQAARDRACTTYALLHNGEWSSKGRMGWFGMSDDKMDQQTWDHLVSSLIDGLPDDTLLSVVDCHI